MKKQIAKVLFALALTGCVRQVDASPLDFVKDGKPNATIVVQAGASKTIYASALDLQEYIQKISGVQLPLTTNGKDVPGITLNIGKTSTAQSGDFPDSSLNPETYAITQRGDDVYFTGNYQSPITFAVYSFIQDQLGVRWFAPGDDWEYVPVNSDKSTFTVDMKSVVSVPTTSPRSWVAHNWTNDWEVWQLRNKVAVSEKVPWSRAQPTGMRQIFPQSKYRKTHPEYYPLVTGKRWIPVRDSQRVWWSCMGNKDVQRITAEYIHQWFQDHPEEDSYQLQMDDVAYMCNDSLCRALDAPGDFEKRNFSNRYYKFINIVAKQVQKTDPGKYIGMLIYDIVVNPPTEVSKVESNTFGYIANGRVAQWYLPGKKEAWIDNAKEWHKRVEHLSRYDYYGLGTFSPRVYPHSMYESMKVDSSLGFEGAHFELYTFLPQTAPMTWALAQLQWDFNNNNVDDLLQEFYTKMYGLAAPTMQKYFELMEESWNTSRPGHDTISTVNNNIIAQATSISPEAAVEGRWIC